MKPSQLAALFSMPVVESAFVPRDVVLLSHADGRPPHVVVNVGRTYELAKWARDAERYPVLSMGPTDWAAYRRDPRWLTPGEWLLERRREIAEEVAAEVQRRMVRGWWEHYATGGEVFNG